MERAVPDRRRHGYRGHLPDIWTRHIIGSASSTRVGPDADSMLVLQDYRHGVHVARCARRVGVLVELTADAGMWGCEVS